MTDDTADYDFQYFFWPKAVVKTERSNNTFDAEVAFNKVHYTVGTGFKTRELAKAAAQSVVNTIIKDKWQKAAEDVLTHFPKAKP